MSLCIFTIVARNYAALALTMADSVVAQHPDADLRIFVADGIQGLPSDTQHRFCSVDDMLGADGDALRFKYNITEFCTSIKPLLFQQMLADTDAELVYYLDPDTWLFGPLDVIHQSAPLASVFLTPHLLHCRPELDHAYPEYKHLWEGIFNLGFCAVRRTPQTLVFLDWWARRLRDHCYADHFEGLHTDQKWMDYAPAYLRDGLRIVPQQGVNVAHWNLDERALTEGPDGLGLTVNGEPLLLFHFSGFDFKGQMLTRHAELSRQQRYFSSTLLDLASRYRAAVHANGFDALIGIPYRFNQFDNGRSVTALHRRLYRSLGQGSWDARPFDSTGRLYRLLEQRGLLDDSPAARKDHAAATLPGLDRLTTVAQGMLAAFLRVFGPRRYAYLLKFFNKYAQAENHVFLLGASRGDRMDGPHPARER